MAITTYAELKTAIETWLNRADLSSYTGDFITLAESMMDNDSRLRTRHAVVRSTLSVSSQFTTLPTAFRRMINVEYQTTPVRPLEYLPPQRMDDVRSVDPTGTPYYYSIHGTELEVAPVPDSAVTLGIIYWAGITALSVSNTSNWLLAARPDIYLYASLIQTAPFLKEDERIGVWRGMYDQLCNDYAAASEADQISGAPLIVTSGVIG